MPLDESQVKAFGVLKDRLCSGRPKTFVADDIQRPVLNFKDGALEYDNGEPKATIGGVCLRPDGSCEILVLRFLTVSWKSGRKVERLM